MSKKSRRLRTPNLPESAYNVPVRSAAVDTATVQSAIDGGTGTVNLNEEYSEVIGDLRRTFLIFIGMAVAMLALSFVIR
jgi:hypothetical protein